MQEEHYESPEELDARFEEEENNSLEHDRLYFWENPTDIGAKVLWLNYTKLQQDIPEEVMERMIRIIEDDIENYKDNGHKRRSTPGSFSRKDTEEPIFDLLHVAKEEPDLFWRILYPSLKGPRGLYFYPAWLLENLRTEFPQPRKLTSVELYDFFGKQLGLETEEDDSTVDERMSSRYLKTYKKNLAKLEKLFKP